MSEESKKVEKAEKNEQEVKPAELSEQDLEKVAGGGANALNTSRSNIRGN
ncbi:MAG: hypothetical protein ABSH49_31830 [Bryobacteraceae bacterium]|jgi:hypothetical protein